MDQSTIDSIIDELKQFSPSSKLQSLVDALGRRLTGLPRPEVERLVFALVSLYAVRASSNATTEEFGDQLLDAIQAFSDEKEPLKEGDIGSFKERVKRLLGVSAFADTVKARDLQTEYDRVFCDARIFTDLRPVFGTDLDEGAHAMVVVHMLRIGFHQGSERHQEFYVALDSDDLATLRNLIERSQAKARSLRKTIERDGIQFFDI